MINTTEIGVNYEYLVRDTLRMLSFEDSRAAVDLKHDLILQGCSGVKSNAFVQWRYVFDYEASITSSKHLD